jgi:hypothetical protein
MCRMVTVVLEVSHFHGVGNEKKVFIACSFYSDGRHTFL